MAKYFVSGLITTVRSQVGDDNKKHFDRFIDYPLIVSEADYADFRNELAEKLNAHPTDLEVTNLNVLFKT